MTINQLLQTSGFFMFLGFVLVNLLGVPKGQPGNIFDAVGAILFLIGLITAPIFILMSIWL